MIGQRRIPTKSLLSEDFFVTSACFNFSVNSVIIAIARLIHFRWSQYWLLCLFCSRLCWSIAPMVKVVQQHRLEHTSRCTRSEKSWRRIDRSRGEKKSGSLTLLEFLRQSDDISIPIATMSLVAIIRKDSTEKNWMIYKGKLSLKGFLKAAELRCKLISLIIMKKCIYEGKLI